MKIVKIGILVCLAGLVFGCGPKNELSKAKKMAEKGRYQEAWERFQEFVARHPSHELAPEALFRAGWTSQQGLQDCYMAKVFYERVAAEYPNSEPWARAATLQQLNCPDYFPLIPGSTWEEGDSDTKGGIARTVVTCQPLSYNKDFLPSQTAKLERVYYAGKKKSITSTFVYRKENEELLEFISETDPRAKVVMKWPLAPDTAWKTRMGGLVFSYDIVSNEETVKVVAGEFSNCVKIRSRIEGSLGSRYFYYAPGVGRVLVTQGTNTGEQRHTELLSYDMKEFLGFDQREEKEEGEK